MKLISDTLGYDVCTVNENVGANVIAHEGRYHIFNATPIYTDTPVIKHIYKIFLVFFFIFKSLHYDIIILSGGLDSPLLQILPLHKCIVYISRVPEKKDKISSFYLSKCRGFITEISNGKEYLIENKIPHEKILEISPIVPLEKKHMPVPEKLPISILFASSPRKTISRKETYAMRGIPTLLDAIELVHESYDISLTLLWRDDYIERIISDIHSKKLSNYVTVINRNVDIVDYLKTHHLLVIPYLSSEGMPDYPLSALESLVSGRPVVSTPVSPISSLLQETGCGVIARSSKPTDLADAIITCIRTYDSLTKKCKEMDIKFMNEESLKNMNNFVML